MGEPGLNHILGTTLENATRIMEESKPFPSMVSCSLHGKDQLYRHAPDSGAGVQPDVCALQYSSV